MISTNTPGYIAPDKHYEHVPNYSHVPPPKQAKGQQKIIHNGRETKGKVFTDVRNGHTTILIDR